MVTLERKRRKCSLGLDIQHLLNESSCSVKWSSNDDKKPLKKEVLESSELQLAVDDFHSGIVGRCLVFFPKEHFLCFLRRNIHLQVGKIKIEHFVLRLHNFRYDFNWLNPK